MISKGRLVEIKNSIGTVEVGSYECGQLRTIEQLIEECGEDDKLRPMCDAPLEVPILVDTGKDLREAFVSRHGDEIMVIFSDCSLANSNAFGWRPI